MWIKKNNFRSKNTQKIGEHVVGHFILLLILNKAPQAPRVLSSRKHSSQDGGGSDLFVGSHGFSFR